jgi:uncharacterized protein (DUF2267 family)
MERLGMTDAHYALRGLTAVLHALRDELSANQNAALASQMPTMLRGLYFQEWKPQPVEPKHSSRDVFLRRVDAAFDRYEMPPNPVDVVQNVFAMLEYRMSGECRKIRRTLPSDLRGLWPTADEDLDEQ